MVELTVLQKYCILYLQYFLFHSNIFSCSLFWLPFCTLFSPVYLCTICKDNIWVVRQKRQLILAIVVSTGEKKCISKQKPKNRNRIIFHSKIDGTYLKMATKSICFEHDAQWLIFVFFSCERKRKRKIVIVITFGSHKWWRYFGWKKKAHTDWNKSYKMLFFPTNCSK